MQLRPDLAWIPVKGATHYLVFVQSHNQKLEQIVFHGSRLNYPQTWPELQYGKVYQVTVFAYQRDKVISSDRTKLNLLFEEEVNVIDDAVRAISQLPLSPTEAAKELDAVYMSYKLLHQSIGILKRLSEIGQSNHQLDRLLMDRYYQAGQPELAPKTKTTQEAQLPTRMKFPQK
jgi:hypothetical protein